MMTRSLALSADLPRFALGFAMVLAVLALGLIVWELAHHRRKAWLVGLTGVLATLLLLAAVLRPVWISSRASMVGPRVIVLADRSLSMELPGDSGVRDAMLQSALRSLRDSAKDARLTVLGFGEGPAQPVTNLEALPAPDQTHSDLLTALHSIASTTEETPAAIVVLSDGRFESLTTDQSPEALRQTLGWPSTPIHTIAVSKRIPADASVRTVRSSGAAVAHQPFTVTVGVGCDGGLDCSGLQVTVRELVESGSPLVLASGSVSVSEGAGTVELPITLDRVGPRVVEVSVSGPSQDEIPENNRRFLTFDVTRDRVRILHIAGRPTYDVRALRQWLKSDASLDVVAFFILRSLMDDVNASPDELALIRFPVDELFSEHLSSFDAVVLQDFNANPYGLSPYLSNLAQYVESGGGLIMVGGLNAFSAGGYAGTPLERVLPVALTQQGDKNAVDSTPFVPELTAAGKDTPVLEALRALVGDRLPEMSGTNVLGEPHAGTVVLWQHPTLRTSSGSPMPVLALGEHGNGRSLALSVDDTHKFAFSELAARSAGRAYGALWDALLGWLMRDPRYEPARIELASSCRAGVPTQLRIRSLPGLDGPIQLTLLTLGRSEAPRTVPVSASNDGKTYTVQLPALAPGGYTARIRIGSGPSTRRDFACERGGDEWADSRPDLQRLEAISKATQARALLWSESNSLRFPQATAIATERHVSALLPPWVWTVAAATALGAHWIARRRVGLA